jgi:hypothetical protein
VQARRRRWRHDRRRENLAVEGTTALGRTRRHYRNEYDPLAGQTDNHERDDHTSRVTEARQRHTEGRVRSPAGRVACRSQNSARSDVLKNSPDQPGCESWFRRASGVRDVRSWTEVDVPGFVDMHVHGEGGGSSGVGDLANVRHAVEFHRSGGTTNTPESLVTLPPMRRCSSSRS